MRLRDFVPTEWCLRCDRCCRFNSAINPWIPVFSAKEVEEIINRGQDPVVFNKSEDEADGIDVRVKVRPYQDYYVCPFFDVEKNCCRIYPFRPFDCRLYPFLLVKKEGSVYIGIDKDCPFVAHLYEDEQDWVVQKFADYLVDALLSVDGRDEVGSHPSMIAEYPGNVSLLRELRF